MKARIYVSRLIVLSRVEYSSLGDRENAVRCMMMHIRRSLIDSLALIIGRTCGFR